MTRHRWSSRLAATIERASALDRPAEAVGGAVGKVLAAPPLRSVLSGTWLGHPAHPLLIAGPIGCWTSAALMDLAGDPAAATRLTGAGIALSLPTAATGMSDWLDTSGAERRVGLAHLAANSTALALYTASWLARRRGRRALGPALGVIGAAALGAGGWLGGHLSYALGVGVDTNAFAAGATDGWVPLAVDVPADGSPVTAAVGATPVVAIRRGTGARVLGERCSHRGGPLSEGRFDEDCVTCPWHGSRFSLETGEVRRGPAVVPQPVYEVSDAGDGLRVRREEPRALRTNPAQAQ